MRIPIQVTPGRYWSTRTPTKHGHIDPPKFGGRYGPPPSTVEGRHRDREGDRLRREHNVVLSPDMLVVWDRAPHRIVEIRELPDDLWPEKYNEAWKSEFDRWIRTGRGDEPVRATWKHRPVEIVLIPDGKPKAKRLHLKGPASKDWDVLPEHYAVCHACGELPPCRHELQEQEIGEMMHATEDLMAIQPGCCLGCGEPITHRQKATRFPGPNLWRPDLGDDSAVFHGRQECAYWVRRYREQWQEKGHAELQPQLPEEQQ